MTRKNLLFVVPDQLRGDWLGFLGKYPVRTPNVDKLAARGVTFTQAWTPSPLCAPARACMVTLKNYDNSPVRSNHDNLSPEAPNYFRELRDAGYRVASTGKMDLLKQAMSWGYDGRHVVNGESLFEMFGLTDGLDSGGKHNQITAAKKGRPEPYVKFLQDRGLAETHIADYDKRELINPARPVADLMSEYYESCPAVANGETTPLPDDAYCDNWIGERSIETLKKMEGDDPWFLMVNFAGPHEPMDVTRSMAEVWKDTQFDLPRHRDNQDPEIQLQMRRNYAAMIENIDRWLGKFVDYLEESGQIDNTVIVFTSDHGEMLGDFGLYSKELPFEPSVTVPLVYAGPGIRQNVKIADPVTLVDVTATFLDLADAGIPDYSDGLSLKSVLTDENAKAVRDVATSGLGSWRAITDGRYKLVAGFDKRIHYNKLQHASWKGVPDGMIELYDLKNDPLEDREISEQNPEIVKRLLDRLLEETGLDAKVSA